MEYYICHHGVKGQKWGIKNGPPYPLSDHSTKSSAKQSINTKSIVGKYKNKKVGVIDPITVAVTAATIAAIAVPPALVQIDKAKDKHELLHTRQKTSKVKKIDDLPKIKTKDTTENNAKQTNPGFPQKGRTVNCTFCTAAMAMREKGYDVQARSTDHCWYSDMIYKNAFRNSGERKQMTNNDTKKTLIKKLNGEGDGAYGELSVVWNFGGGHSIFWKNENGITKIFDGQSGEEYSTTNLKNNMLFDNVYIPMSSYVRLDNAKPTEYILSVVEPRKGDNV